MGLRDRLVIPVGWEAHHRPVARGTMTAICEILEAVPRAGLEDAPSAVVGVFPCRVQQHNKGDNGAGASREVVTREYLVALPHDTGINFKAGVDGHRLRIIEASTTALVGRIFTVVQLLTGSLVWETDLICEDDQTQNSEVG